MRPTSILVFILLVLSCGGQGSSTDDQLRGSTASDLWNMATPQLKFKFCIRDKIAAFADRSKTAKEPRNLEDAYLPFARSVDSCASLVPNDTQWATPIGEAVKIKVRETLGEVSADYLSEMELVQSGRRDRSAALESWRMWTMVGVHEADALIPE